MSGVLKDKEDTRDFIKEIPENVEKKSVNLLDGLDYTILNQKDTSSCTGFASAYFFSILYSKILGEWCDFNPWFTYYLARNGSLLGEKDQGAYPREVFKACKEKGVLLDSGGDYFGVTGKPSEEDFKRASKLKIKSYFRIPNNNVINGIIHTLTEQGLPVFIALYLKQKAWSECHKTGILDVKDEDWPKAIHAMCVYGYDKDTDEFLLLNSYGTFFGDEGKLRVSSRYVIENVSDCWTVGYDYF